MFVCKLFKKNICAPCFSARCDTVLDSCDVAIGYFTNHPIDIDPGMVCSRNLQYCRNLVSEISLLILNCDITNLVELIFIWVISRIFSVTLIFPEKTG